jgi:hypothetical protein
MLVMTSTKIPGPPLLSSPNRPYLLDITDIDEES